MKKNLVMTAAIMMIATVLAGPAFGLDFKKKKKDGPMCAIMDFENKTEYWGWRLGRACSDVLQTEVLKGTPLRCMERDKLSSIMKEKNLSASGLTTPNTYVKMGGMLGAGYIITGAVSSFGERQVGGSGFGVGAKIKIYRAEIDVRIIDSQTGEIIFADSAVGEKKGMKLRIMGAGGGEDFDQQAAAKILRVACKEMAKKISAALE